MKEIFPIVWFGDDKTNPAENDPVTEVGRFDIVRRDFRPGPTTSAAMPPREVPGDSEDPKASTATGGANLVLLKSPADGGGPASAEKEPPSSPSPAAPETKAESTTGNEPPPAEMLQLKITE